MSRSQSIRLLITCEHGGNQIPPEYAALFNGTSARRALASHRGYDPGALATANLFASLDGMLFTATVSRLLVDLNRSANHPRVFSEFTSVLTSAEKAEILAKHYAPYRDVVTSQIRKWVSAGDRVVHVSVHSFTPVFGGKSRNIDVGWLYDPKRTNEKTFCTQWIKAVLKVAPTLRLRRNAPYKGASDGFTTTLRRQSGDTQYAGIELELSQGFARNEKQLQSVGEMLTATLQEVFSET